MTMTFLLAIAELMMLQILCDVVMAEPERKLSAEGSMVVELMVTNCTATGGYPGLDMVAHR